MREPKYRVWIKSLNKYLPIASIDFYYKTVWVWGCGNENCGLCDDEYSFNDVIFEQYTGLKDKNGKEIYGGDVDSSGFIVTYVDGSEADSLGMSIGFYVQRDNFESWVELSVGDEIEIIGNIHDVEVQE